MTTMACLISYIYSNIALLSCQRGQGIRQHATTAAAGAAAAAGGAAEEASEGELEGAAAVAAEA